MSSSAPGMDPGTGIAGLNPLGRMWNGWLCIALRAPLTDEQLHQIRCIDSVYVAEPQAGNFLFVATPNARDTHVVLEVVGEIAESLSTVLGYQIVIKAWVDPNRLGGDERGIPVLLVTHAPAVAIERRARRGGWWTLLAWLSSKNRQKRL